MTQFQRTRHAERGMALPSTLADVVYERLHSDIVLGRMAPNELLLEADLAASLQTSRTPVREALLRLAKDGLIISRSRRWIVAQTTLEEIRDIYGVRAALEGYAARIAAENASPEEIDAISEALVMRSHAGESIEELVASNEEFHRSVVAASGNPRLTAAHEANKHYYFNFSLAQLYKPDDLAASHREHQALLAAIRAGDGDEADRITRRHVQATLEIIEQRYPTVR